MTSSDVAVISPLPPLPAEGNEITAASVEDLEQRIDTNLVLIEDIQTAREWLDQAGALEAYLRRRGLHAPMMGAERRVEARIGQLLGDGPGTGVAEINQHADLFHTQIRKEFRLLKKALDGEVVLAREEWRQSRRALVRHIRQELYGSGTLEVTGTYRVVYADPPWSYGNTQPDYHPEQGDHYSLMSLDEICAIPVKEHVEDDAVLFLWVTSPILEESFEVIKAWGFKYKASFVWDKVKHNMGHYNSVRHELLLVAVRGSCQPDVRKLYDSVYVEERGAHSRKPDHFREIIETLYPTGEKAELFGREQRDGWAVLGNEL